MWEHLLHLLPPSSAVLNTGTEHSAEQGGIRFVGLFHCETLQEEGKKRKSPFLLSSPAPTSSGCCLGQVSMWVPCCLFMTLHCLDFKYKQGRERRKGKSKGKEDKEGKNKVFLFFSHRLCLFFLLLISLLIFQSNFPFPCLHPQRGEQEQNKQKDGEGGKAEGTSGEFGVFSEGPVVVKLLFCQYPQFRWFLWVLPRVMLLPDPEALLRGQHWQMSATKSQNQTNFPAESR